MYSHPMKKPIQRLNFPPASAGMSAPAQTISPGKNSQLHIKLLIQEEIVLSINIKIHKKGFI